jgi:hypothetical protein
MFKMALKYVHSVFMLHVSATQGHLQATRLLKEFTALCNWSNSTLKAHRVIINFDVVGCFASDLLYCCRFCVRLGVLFSWLYVSSVALYSLSFKV